MERVKAKYARWSYTKTIVERWRRQGTKEYFMVDTVIRLPNLKDKNKQTRITEERNNEMSTFENIWTPYRAAKTNMTKELSLEVSYTLLIMCPSQQTEKKNRL
jgi:hypothetical protein